MRWRSGGSPGTEAPTPAATTASRPYSHTRAAAPTPAITWGKRFAGFVQCPDPLTF